MAPATSSADETPLVRTLTAGTAALGAGAIALVFPPLALLCLALLAALALLRSGTVRAKITDLLGPLSAIALVGAFFGLAAAVGMTFLWRLIEDARWSANEAVRRRFIAGFAPTTAFANAHMWLTPLYCVTLVAYTAPHTVAGLPLDLPHVPSWVPLAAGAAALAVCADWMLRLAVDWRLGQAAGDSAAHMVSHHVIFLVAFGLGLDVSAGVVALAAWRLAHAAQLKPPQASFTAVP